MYTLKVKSHFDAAHYIKDYDGKCSREHGHRWDVEVAIKKRELDALNMVFDFSGIKDTLEVILDMYLDHYQLNESLGEPNVTAEYIASWIYRHLKAIPVLYPLVASVTVWESPDCSVTYEVDVDDLELSRSKSAKEAS